MSPFCPPDLEAFFEPVAVAVLQFAEAQGLLLEKYYHESATWSLCFGHPKGGQAKVEIAAVGPEEVQVSAIWWMDDYKSFTRNLRWGRHLKVPREPIETVRAVKSLFAEALQWTPGTWNQVADGYRPYWSDFTEQEFYAFANPWPLPHRAQ